MKGRQDEEIFEDKIFRNRNRKLASDSDREKDRPILARLLRFLLQVFLLLVSLSFLHL